MDESAVIFFVLVAIASLVASLIAWNRSAKAERDLTNLAERTRQLEWQLELLRNRQLPPDLDQATELEPDAGEAAAESPGIQEATLAESLIAARPAARNPAHAPSAEPLIQQPRPALPHVEPPPLLAAAQEAQLPGQALPPAVKGFERTKTGIVRPPSRKPVREPFNWEQFMGVRLFAWVGGFALFLGAVFAIKYSFEQGWISPALRVTMGFATGMGLLVGGIRLSQKRYKVTADTLSATGVVILYAVTFACRAVYHFAPFGVMTTFALMTLITIVAFFIASRMNAQVVAVLGLLGGFLTPVLVNEGHDNPFGLFSYIALLDAGLLALVYARRWDWLSVAAAIGTVLMQAGWVGEYFFAKKVFIALAVFLGFPLLFLAGDAVSHRNRRSNPWLVAAVLLMAASTFMFILRLFDDAALSQRPGILSLFLLGADLIVLALATLHVKPGSEEKEPVTSAAAPRIPGGLSQTGIPSLSWLNPIAGAIVFLLLAVWTGAHMRESQLFWSLGGSLVVAILHTVYPLILRRWFDDEPIPLWTQLLPFGAMLVMLIPIVRFEDISFLLWPFVMLVDLLAIGAAILVASFAGIVIALLVTGGLALVWLTRIPAELTGLPEMLIVIVAMAGLFTAAGVFAGNIVLARQGERTPKGHSEWLPDGWTSADVQQQIPALSAVLPYFLLLVVTGRIWMANPALVFGTALVLAALLLGLTRGFDLNWLPAIGLGCTCLIESAWYFRSFETSHAALAVAWFAVFYAVYGGYPFICHRGDGSRLVAWISAALAGPLHFWLIYRVAKVSWSGDFMGMVPAVFAIPALTGLVEVFRQLPADHPKRNAILSWFGGVALLFISLIFPIQFKHEWLTIAWASEGAALLWLFQWVPHHGLRYTGAGFLVTAFVRLALNPAVFDYHVRSATPIFNWYLYTFGLVIAATFAGARLLRPPHHKFSEADGRVLLMILGTVLAFLLINIEIADYFTPVGEPSLTFSFRGNFARDMSYTIGWSLFAFVLMVTGIIRRIQPARWAGMGLLAVTLLKLFLHDLAALNQLYRVGALIGVAVVAIVASFLYQKFLTSTADTETTNGNA